MIIRAAGIYMVFAELKMILGYLKLHELKISVA